jgi:hypothetical protein
MAFKPRKNCLACQAVRKHPPLMERLFKSRAFGNHGRDVESVLAISRDTGIPYGSLVSHCKFHQYPDETDIGRRDLERLAKAESRQLIQKSLTTKETRQQIIDRLAAVLEDDDFKSLLPKDKVALILKATKDTDDVAAKAKDQSLDWMKAMQGARSGEYLEGEVIEPSTEELPLGPTTGDILGPTEGVRVGP